MGNLTHTEKSIGYLFDATGGGKWYILVEYLEGLQVLSKTYYLELDFLDTNRIHTFKPFF